jgi:hypothetical protein
MDAPVRRRLTETRKRIIISIVFLSSTSVIIIRGAYTQQTFGAGEVTYVCEM